MHPIRLLAKLSPKTINLNGSGHYRSVDALDWQDAAHALVGLSPEASAWAFYRFAGQDAQLCAVKNALMAYAVIFVKIAQYRMKYSTIEGLVNASIVEFTQPLCGACKGAGINEFKSVECPVCQGHGRMLMSLRKRCKIIGIDHRSFSARHDAVCKELLRLIAQWEAEIMANVYQKMDSAQENCA